MANATVAVVAAAPSRDAHRRMLIATVIMAALFAVAPFVGAAASVLALGDRLNLLSGAAMAAGIALLLHERHEHHHVHEPIAHDHLHVHDTHHDHEHAADVDPREPHSHPHRHSPLSHAHPHVSDAHHRHRH